MPRSGTNSQGNSYTTPGGSNSNSGSSYHCKLKIAIPHPTFTVDRMENCLACVSMWNLWYSAIVWLRSLFPDYLLTSFFVHKTHIAQTRTRTGRITTPTTTDRPTTTMVREAAHTLRLLVTSARNRCICSGRAHHSPHSSGNLSSIYNSNLAQALDSSVGRITVTKQ